MIQKNNKNVYLCNINYITQCNIAFNHTLLFYHCIMKTLSITEDFFDYEFFKSLAELYKDLTGTVIPENIVAISFLLTITVIVLFIILGIWHKNYKWRKNQLDTILKGYENYTTRQEQRLYIDTGLQTEPPHDYDEPSEAQYQDLRNSSIDFFIKQVFRRTNNNPPYYCILGGSGMGKSTFAVNLVLKYINKYTKKNLPYDIRLLYCGESTQVNNLIHRIKELENKNNTILILDALDENNEAINEFSNFFIKMLNELQDFRIVIITCRTQFFEKKEEEPNLLPFRDPKTKKQKQFKKYYISPLNDYEIQHYLNKKFVFKFSAKKKAKNIVEQCNQIMARPLLLSYIDDLVNSDISDYSITQIYDIIINKWLEREASFAAVENENEYKTNLLNFSSEIALRLAQDERNCSHIDNIIKKYSSIITEKNLRGRSLLNRNSKNEYKFAHKSFLEFLVAKQILEADNISLESINCTSNDMILTFLSDMLDLDLSKLTNQLDKTSDYSYTLELSTSIHWHCEKQQPEFMLTRNLNYLPKHILKIKCNVSENIIKFVSELAWSIVFERIEFDCHFDYQRTIELLTNIKHNIREIAFRNYDFQDESIIDILKPFLHTNLRIDFYIKAKQIFDTGNIEILKFLKLAQHTIPRSKTSITIRIYYLQNKNYSIYNKAFEKVLIQ